MNEQDILQQLDNLDLSTVETSFPLLKTGVVAATIQSIEFAPNKAGDGTNAKIGYVLAQPWSDIEGKPVNPGFPISEIVSLKPWTDDKGETKNIGIQRLAVLREAVLGKAAPGTRFSREELLGQAVTLKLLYNPAPKNKKTGETYGPQTSVDGYVRKAR